MRLSPPALGFAAALLWGAAIFVVGSVGLMAPGYGDAVLSLVASIYPGYDNAGTLPDLLVGTMYALADGFVGGVIFALLYNTVLRLGSRERRRGEAEASGESAAGAPE